MEAPLAASYRGRVIEPVPPGTMVRLGARRLEVTDTSAVASLRTLYVTAKAWRQLSGLAAGPRSAR